MAADRPQENTTLRQSKSALLEAANAAVANQASKPPHGSGAAPTSRAGLRVFLGLVILVGASLLVAKPGWLVGPEPPVESPAIREASATLSLAHALGQIKAYAEAKGSLPSTPGEAGVRDSTIQFRRLGGDAFELSLPAGDRVVSLRSTDSLEPLVVEAIRALQRRS